MVKLYNAKGDNLAVIWNFKIVCDHIYRPLAILLSNILVIHKMHIGWPLVLTWSQVEEFEKHRIRPFIYFPALHHEAPMDSDLRRSWKHTSNPCYPLSNTAPVLQNHWQALCALGYRLQLPLMEPRRLWGRWRCCHWRPRFWAMHHEVLRGWLHCPAQEREEGKQLLKHLVKA